jgi:hypothetical protein
MSWHFYSLETGVFVDYVYEGPDVTLNTPAGCAAISGNFDHRLQMVDVETNEVIDAPEPIERELSQEASRASGLASASSMEVKQLRALREAVLHLFAGQSNEEVPESVLRLRQIENDIGSLSIRT